MKKLKLVQLSKSELNKKAPEAGVVAFVGVRSTNKRYYASTEFIRDFLNAGFNVKIMVHLTDESQELTRKIHDKTDDFLTWIFLVSDENDLSQIEQLKILSEVNYEMIPYFNGSNLSFFKKHVYNDLEDIVSEPVEKQAIFRRQVLNENFFGKLAIFPDGQVYSNSNFPPIGNLSTQKLTEIVFQEISNSKAWLKTRNEGVCEKCIYKNLCPSPGNYEIVIGKFNLCHVKK